MQPKFSQTGRRGAKSGFGLVEVVVGATMLSATLLGVSYFFQKTLEFTRLTENTIKAGYLLEEGAEAARYLKVAGYLTQIYSLTPETPYYLNWGVFTPGIDQGWKPTLAQPPFIDGLFERTITTSVVRRYESPATPDIIPPGSFAVGADDPATRLVTVRVAWREKSATTTQSVSIYIFRY